MNEKQELIKMWFYGFETIGSVGRKKILEKYGSIEEAFSSDKQLLKECLSERQIEELVITCNIDFLIEKREKLTERGVRIIHFESDAYPDKLKNIYDPPGILYLKGRLPETLSHTNKNIAIVGSRKADTYGIELASMFARELAHYGVNIISGLALGVDGAANKSAIEAGGYSLGVLGCGINVTYPRTHAELFYEMEKRGGIISEHTLNVQPLPTNFPRRNRIISALSDGVLVVEAGKRSGSIITADLALEQGKQVYAIPGRIFDANSEGTNKLIKQGAICVTEPEDIVIDLIGTDALKNTSQNNKEDADTAKTDISDKNGVQIALAPLEKMVYSCLSLTPVYIDRIVDVAGITVTEAINCLYGMEQKGVIKQPARGYYIISV